MTVSWRLAVVPGHDFAGCVNHWAGTDGTSSLDQWTLVAAIPCRPVAWRLPCPTHLPPRDPRHVKWSFTGL